MSGKAMTRTASRRCAILIGVNYYGGEAKTLLGAVPDVEEMQKYLTSEQTDSICVLTTKTPLDAQSKVPPGDSSTWATFENVSRSMHAIAETVKAGDHLLFYFCGHGTQTPPSSSKHSHAQTGDLALVLFDERKGVRYLRSSELAMLLKEVTDRKASVTVVLDCCYAASVIRDGENEKTRTRSVKYNPSIDAAYPIDRLLLARSSRDARSMHENFLDSETYSIIAACGPHERADEMKNGRGALSYFLLRTLRAHAGYVTVREVYDHLRLKFHINRPVQTPICYGRKDVFFFGDLKPKHIKENIVVLKEKNGFIIDVGYAHGVCIGDEFALSPFPTSEEDEHAESSKPAEFRAQTYEVGGTTSILNLLESLDPDLVNESRWFAKRVSLPAWQCRVRLSATSPTVAEKCNSAMVNKQFIVPLPEHDEDSSHYLEVEEIEDEKCRILDAKRDPVPNLPPLPFSSKNRSVAKLTNVLQHLAMYEYVRAIANESPVDSFETSFTVYLTSGTQMRCDAGQSLEIRAEEPLMLTIENHGTTPLYIAVFDLGPQWQITNIFAMHKEEFQVLAPFRAKNNIHHEHTGRLDVPLHTNIPDDLAKQGQDHCEDVIKVFVTSKATSFASLETEKLPISEEDYTGTTRGKKNSGDLARFLKSLALPSRGQGSKLPDEHWAARDIILRTVAHQCS
jgi:hypothetical protein